MPHTDIEVHGFARDVRTPDRAEVRLKVSKWGRDLASIHQSVAAAVNGLTTTIEQLDTTSPDALDNHEITQISQRSWTDDIGTAYAESVDVTVTFSDFQVMSQWIFQQPTDLVQVEGITWKLSPATQSAIGISLRVEAMKDARRKAETFAVAAGLVIVSIDTLTDDDISNNSSAVTPAADPPGRNGSGNNHLGINITPVPIETTVHLTAHFLAEPDEVDPHLLPRRTLQSFMASSS